MTRADLDRLYAEALPDGLFGGPRPAAPAPPVPPDPDAAAHRADLLAALAGVPVTEEDWATRTVPPP